MLWINETQSALQLAKTASQLSQQVGEFAEVGTLGAGQNGPRRFLPQSSFASVAVSHYLAGCHRHKTRKDHMNATPATVDSPRTLTADERKAALARAVSMEVRRGWHVQSQTDYQAVILKPGTKVNHILHLILTLVTIGIWSLVWIIVAIAHKRERHAVLDVDQFGKVTAATSF